MIEGWVKVHRKICSNGIWKKPQDFRLFFYLLVNAVFDKAEYDDIIINRGQYLRSYRKLQEDLSYIQNNKIIIPSLSSLKRSIEHLVELKMIETLDTKLGTLFNIVNYEKYQSESDYLTDDKEKLGTKLGTEHGTPTEQQENNNKNDKKEKNEFKKEVREASLTFDNEIYELFKYTPEFQMNRATIEETQSLIKKYGIEKVRFIFKQASLKNFSNFSFLISSLDSSGNIKPFQNNSREITIHSNSTLDKNTREFKTMIEQNNLKLKESGLFKGFKKIATQIESNNCDDLPV